MNAVRSATSADVLCGLLRHLLIAAFCAGCAGCAPVLVMTAATLSGARNCKELQVAAIEISAWQGSTFPTDEGSVHLAAPAVHYYEIVEQSFGMLPIPNVSQFGGPIEGALGLTDDSIIFISSSGVTGLRIPYQQVAQVFWTYGTLGGRPALVTVRNLCGKPRFDSFAFPSSSLSPDDPEARVKAVAAEIDARVLALERRTNAR